jgi:hypothetical protein
MQARGEDYYSRMIKDCLWRLSADRLLQCTALQPVATFALSYTFASMLRHVGELYKGGGEIQKYTIQFCGIILQKK